MIASLLALLLCQNPPPPPPPRPRPPGVEGDEPFGEPRRGPGRPGAAPLPRPEANPDEVKGWLRENEPETFRRVERALEEGRRPEANRLLSEAEPRMREMADQRTRDPKGFERMQELRRMDRESLDLAERVRTAAPAEREAAVKSLKDALGRLFDFREEIKLRELEELKRRMAEIQKQLEARKAAKERIVDRRRRELMGERVEDDW